MSKLTAIYTPPQLLAIARGRAFPILALLAALIACLVLLPGGPVQAHPHDDANPDDMRHIDYAENGTGAVRDFDSTDPEGAVIEWNVRGLDAADFEISSAGVLTFKESPDYENPTDRARAAFGLNGDDNEDPGEAEEDAGDNDYLITVSATEVWDGADTSLPAKRTDMALTVIVGNVDDPGEVTLQWLQPEVGTLIMATLTDSDGSITATDWTWYRSKVGGGVPDVTDPSHWIEIDAALVTEQANEATSSYIPRGGHRG